MKTWNAILQVAKSRDPVLSAGEAAHAVKKDGLMQKDALATMAATIITVVSKTLGFQVDYSAFNIVHLIVIQVLNCT